MQEECPVPRVGGGLANYHIHNHQIKLQHYQRQVNIETAIKELLEEILEEQYHFGNKTGTGFGDHTVTEILERLDQKYGQLSLTVREQLMKAVDEPMNPNDSMERSFYKMEQVNTMLKLCKNGHDKAAMISKHQIKLQNTQVYSKLLLHLEETDKDISTWALYKEECITWYDKHLKIGNIGKTANQGGYTPAYSAKEEDEEN